MFVVYRECFSSFLSCFSTVNNLTEIRLADHRIL